MPNHGHHGHQLFVVVGQDLAEAAEVDRVSDVLRPADATGSEHGLV